MVCVQLIQVCRWVSCLSRLSLFLLCFSVWFTYPVSVVRFAWRVGGCFGFCFLLSPLFSLCLLPAANLCVRRGSCLLFFLSAVEFLSRPLASPSLSLLCVLALRVSRPIVILICSDLVQLSPPVDFCVRELSPHHFESGVVACLVGICSLACHAH